ncbi:MAG: 2,3-bisphosphoglycerate-independent phosphoglycerate mutase [Candidatus Bathyarchaeota archaeon]|nr:MAG: 2,3-bisphosphoglycerate-independent phosphoglycerate mutase [Candidatus Bathyarchaeota archaeon]
MKAVLVIADGMADVPLKELKRRTPLEAAQTLSMDRIADLGICGMIDVIAPGIPPGSDIAHLALLGYDVMEVYTGRGALEAIGSGVDILPNDLAFRCNFASVDKDFNVMDRRAGRIENEDAAKLAVAIEESLRDDPPDVGDILFKSSVQHRAVLRLSGPNLSPMVSDTDPLKTGVKVLKSRPLDNSREAKRTSEILNKLTQQMHEAVKNHPTNEERISRGLLPANNVLIRGVGQLPEIDPLTLLYGIHPAAIAAVPLVRGICKTAGMRLIPVPGATGTYETDVIAKAKAAVEALHSYSFVLIHVKATDLAGHDNRPPKKMKMIEKVDALTTHLINNVDLDKTFIAVTADHTTSSIKQAHSGEPVPVAIMGPHVRVDDVKEFGERPCMKGGLGRIRGKDLMPILVDLLGKAEKAGS